MGRKINNNWPAKKMNINFNQKQWRQDLAMFVHDNLFWPATRVTKSRIISGRRTSNEIREFQVYNSNGISVTVRYKQQDKILYSSDKEIIKKYFESRRVI